MLGEIRGILLAIIGAVELVSAGITVYEFAKRDSNEDSKHIKALIFTIVLLIPLIYLLQYKEETTVSPTSATVNIYCYDENSDLIKHDTRIIYSSQSVSAPMISGYDSISSSVQVTFNSSSGSASPDPLVFYYRKRGQTYNTPTPTITQPPTPTPAPNTYYFSSSRLTFPRELNISVYTGPGTNYYRANNGKAGFESDEFKYGGRIGNWLFVRCSVTGGIRYGWIDVGEYQNTIKNVPTLQFSNAKATVRYQTAIWDSMMDSDLGPLTYLSGGTQVTHLCDFVIEGTTYAYVATTISGRQAYGFVYLSDIQ